MESFWASLKKEQVHHQHYPTRDEARATYSTTSNASTTRSDGTVRWVISLHWISLRHSFPIQKEFKFDLGYLSPFHGVRFFEPLQRYRRRKAIVEPRNGWIKHLLGFRQVSLCGIAKVRCEFKLICAALNLRRMASMRS